MQRFYNLKIATKLIIGFIIVALIAGIVGTVGVMNIRKIQTLDEDMYNRDTAPMDDLTRIGISIERERGRLRDMIIQRNSSDIQADIEKIKELDKTIDESLPKFESGVNDEKVRATFNNLKKAIADFRQFRDNEISLIQSNQIDQAINALYGEGRTIANNIQNITDELMNLKVSLAEQNANINKSTANAATITMVIVIIVGIIIAIALGIFISRMISNPVNKLVDVAGKIAAGDLNVNIDFDSKDEIGNLASSYNGIIMAFKALLDETGRLTQAVLNGQLSVRGDLSKVKGGYAEIVKGINNILDAVIAPLDEAQQVIGKIAVNDYTLEMTGQYKGKLHEFANSINAVHARLLSLQDVAIRVSKGDTSRLDEFLKIGKRSENDKLMPSFIAMMQAIQELINETSMLTNAAMNGNLEVRGNEGRFEGGYKEIIEGFNKTIDAIIEPIQEAAAVLDEIAKGNLQVSVKGNYKGDHAKIKNALNDTIKSFNDVLNDINSAAQQVAAGAKQVSDAAQALSQGATEQASSIEELTASIEEISTQTKQNATNANQANELALAAKDAAAKGNEQMKEMLTAMNDINEASSNISKIIKVIDEIAFQTNILALNAAVEAARAGQHGKGFAVVAEEVRNLAARSANAAKETTTLIESSIKKAEDGTKIANNTAIALNKIVDGVTKAATLVGEIASASNDQAAAIAQINQGIAQVSQVVQTNSATSEESAAASEELSSQAEVLKDMISRFKLKKVDKSLDKLEELSPEILKMLEDMSEKKKNNSSPAEEAHVEVAASKTKIALSDNEFGKY
ncbi:HAMP domain-containing protein [Thermoanaerobacteraceae bacterium SP2]|nr:HAMP domain-containing protein [Thermoanaerobacteraceae bacterium SP2]